MYIKIIASRRWHVFLRHSVLRSTALSLFNVRVWQSVCTTSLWLVGVQLPFSAQIRLYQRRAQPLSRSSLVYLLVWSPPLRTLLRQISVFFFVTRCHLFSCSTKIISSTLVSLSTTCITITWNSISYRNITFIIWTGWTLAVTMVMRSAP